MQKLKLTILLIPLLIISFGAVSAAAPISQSVAVSVAMDLNPADPGNKSDILLSWEFTTGDVLKKSFDGRNWITLAPDVNGTSATYKEVGAANWSVMYFQVENGTAITRVNVFPPNENAHANYTSDTNMCKYCHDTHNAPRAKLLNKPQISEMCFTCHGYLNTGSRYNVYNGAVISAGTKDPLTGMVTAAKWQKSLGGPYFGNNMGVWGKDANNNNRPLTSNHPLSYFSQECLICHSAHARNNNYRLLITDDGSPVDAYAVNTAGDVPEQGIYNANLNRVCAGCHSVYTGASPSGSGSTPYYTDGKYRHAVGVNLSWNGSQNDGVINLTTTLPLEGQPGKIMCLTCHFPHGSTAAGINGETSLGSFAPTSRLKKLDNMAVCQNCHMK